MPGRYEGPPASEMTETSRIDRLGPGQTSRELRPRADAEPRIRARQMHFDRVDREVERAGDLLVRPPLRGEVDDLALGWRELAARPRPPPADALEIGPRAVGPPLGTELRERGDRGLERLARGAPLLEPPLGTAQAEQRARAVEAEPERAVRRRGVRQRLGRV